MKSLLVVCLVFAVGCTKPNPNRCCVDEADCAANDIAVGSECDEGLLCRGHQCIAIPCASSTGCDATAPYCVADACAEFCDSDGQCPGFAQSGEFCVEGRCTSCRDSLDCGINEPVCDSGACRKCETHPDCPSGACASNGACVAENAIAYVDAGGASTSDCSRSAPCTTVSRALTVASSRLFIVIASGIYPEVSELSPDAERWIIGAGAAPSLTRSTAGPIITLATGATLHLDNLVIEGAAGTEGAGIYRAASGGLSTVYLRGVTIRDNEFVGVYGAFMTLIAAESVFANNSQEGLRISESNVTIDRCVIVGNGRGADLDGGVFKLTNNFVIRNKSDGGYGLNLYSANPGNQVDFNTIADNGSTSSAAGWGVNCNVTVPTSMQNNVIARNTKQTMGSTCTYPGALIVDNDVTALKFVSPDVAPYDYHLQAGSIAIDASTISTLDHDFDGDARPNGAHRDVGADEYVP